jgi:hypothetical protein
LWEEKTDVFFFGLTYFFSAFAVGFCLDSSTTSINHSSFCMALKRHLIQQASSYLCTSSSAIKPATFLARPFSLPYPFPCSSTSSRYSHQTRADTSPSLLPSPQAPSRRTYTTDTPSPPPGVKIGGERIASEGDHVSIDPHTKRRLPKDDARRPGPGKERTGWGDDVGLDVGNDGVVRGTLYLPASFLYLATSSKLTLLLFPHVLL